MGGLGAAVRLSMEQALGLSLATAQGEAAGATVRTTADIAAAHISFGLNFPEGLHPDRERSLALAGDLAVDAQGESRAGGDRAPRVGDKA
ncbi:hypothetical protein GCM10023170_033950 [Phytohabitans houttuyneae]|uniref:Uncharacterized protein n=1 Tax=Phytohabitans houttuyneae TaxID=1076126 RepID=A0A6V8K4Z6_9ACTN|nr:hypothetical protein Phou_000250 [Phytohabitans houttuyneae]